MATGTTLALTLKELTAGNFITIEKINTGGSLQARRLSQSQVQFYWRYSHAGRTHREPLGTYDPHSPPKKLEPTPRGLSIAAARERCRMLAATHNTHREIGGLREAKSQVRQQHQQTKAAAELRAEKTLTKMLSEYVAFLHLQGRVCAPEVRNVFERDVNKAWPAIAALPACDVTQDQVVDMMRRLVQAGKGRQANKLRAFLRAAYQCALDVRVTATIPIAFKAYGITSNPVAQTKRDARFDRADKRPLSLEEMRAYWRLLENAPGLQARCLRLHLLTGGQRIQQLSRLRWADVRADTITIFDAKGRPTQAPRAHVVPLTRAAVHEMQAFERVGDYVMSTTGGEKPIFGSTLSLWAQSIVGDAINDFQLKRVRSGVETLLASLGVSRDVRGHLQSHGMTGIQFRHYDGHDYLREKVAALEQLALTLVK